MLFCQQELKIENQKFKKENKELINRIIVLEKDNLEFKNKINNLEFEKIITKIITAVQYINSKNNLKKIILKKSLRRQRNANNHYFNEDYTDYEIDCRKLYLLNKLKELSNEQITLINNRICKNEDFINKIINYLDSNVDKQIQINEDIDNKILNR